MITILKEKRIMWRLVILSLITTPLFAILGGTPFFRFDFKDLGSFLPGIIFTAIITILFWVINISLLLIAEKYAILKNIFLRSAISIIIGVLLSAVGFAYFMPNRQAAQPRFSVIDSPSPNSPRFLNRVKDTGDLQSRDSSFIIAKQPEFRAPGPGRKLFFFPRVLRSLTINLIILTLCELVFLSFRKQEVENENTMLRQMNLEAKNSQLKMQLHPHFLFNSLNTLRLLLKKDTGKAEDYLLKLSEILRFSTTSALNNVVNIEDEINLCMAYLEMQKVRFDEMLHFQVTYPELFETTGKLPVYSLQLLAENAIKHNAFTNDLPLTIYIDYNAAAKTITVRNKLQPKRTMESTSGTGLKNLDKRYKLLNGQGISVSNSSGEFAVTINIL